MEITFREAIINYKNVVIAKRGMTQGTGATKEEAIKELERWEDIMGNIKWVDAFTGQVVK